MVYAAAWLVLERGGFSVVDATALQGKLFEDFTGISLYCIVSSSRGFCLKQAPLVYEVCVNPLLSSRSAAH